jgi:hypothetical protein
VILIWGGNPIASNLHFWMRARKPSGAAPSWSRSIPYRSLTAEKCHHPYRAACRARTPRWRWA